MLPATTSTTELARHVPQRIQNDAHLVTLFLKRYTDKKSTVEAYSTDLTLFGRFIQKPLRDVTLDDVLDFKNWLIEDKRYKPATVNRKLSAVRGLFAFATRKRYVPVNPAHPDDVTDAPVERALADRILPAADVLRMIDREPDSRNQTLLLFLYASGARVSEVCGLTWANVLFVDDGRAFVSLWGQKSSKSRTIKVDPGAADALRKLRGEMGDHAPVFATRTGKPLVRSHVHKIVRRAARRAGITRNVSAHWLRHAHVSHALDNGCPVHVVRQTVGHASLQTTTAYAHARPGESSGQYLLI